MCINAFELIALRDSYACITPSLGTGVSIETERAGHVFGIFEGKSITDTDILQMLGRVRANCPRSVWVRAKGSAYSRLSHSAQPSELKKALKSQTEVIAATLRHQLSETAYSGLKGFEWDTDPHIECFCQIEAERNQAMPNLRERVKYRLKAEGNTFLMSNAWEDKGCAIALKETRKTIEAEEAAAIEAAEEIGETTAALLAAKEAPTIEERRALKRYHLADFYLAEVSAELVLADKKGRKRQQVRNFEAMNDEALASKRDVDAIEKQLQWGDALAAQDVRNGSIAAEVRRLIGLPEWIARTDAWLSGCDELEEFKAYCLEERVAAGIKKALGYTVREEASAQQILGDLLGQVGVNLKKEQKQKDGVRFRQYSIDIDSLAELEALAQRRAEQRERANNAELSWDSEGGDHPPAEPEKKGLKQKCTPPPGLKQTPEGVCTQKEAKASPDSSTGAGAQLDFAGCSPERSPLSDSYYDAGVWH